MGRQSHNVRGQQKQPKPPPVCAFCGIRPGKERGHVVPQAFFQTLPLINLTVPACHQCERGNGDGVQRPINMDEEYIANIICLDVSSQNHEEAKWLSEHRVMRSFSNSPAMRDAIIQTVTPILPQNDQGIILPEVHYSFEFKLDRLERVVRKITRGLFYFNNGRTPLPPDYEVRLIPRLPHDLFYKLLDKFKLASHVGPFKLGENEVFTYMAARQPHDHNQQFYMMAFYKAFVSVGYTMPRSAAPDAVQPPSPIIRAVV